MESKSVVDREVRPHVNTKWAPNVAAYKFIDQCRPHQRKKGGEKITVLAQGVKRMAFPHNIPRMRGHASIRGSTLGIANVL